MNCRYFRVMPNAYEEKAGDADSPDWGACPHVYDGEDVERSKVFVYELKGGKYCPYLMGPWTVNLVDENLKTLLDEYVEKEYVEFFPVIVHSKEYGDRQYYIVHFTKIYDAIDKEHTVYGLQ